jgi:thiol-disulfide isomerase/thioredoxin
MKPRPLRFAAALALCAAWAQVAGAADTAVSFQSVSFDAACVTAKTGEKVVVIDFFTTWCEPCKRLDKETWTDARVGKLLNEKAVALKLDAEKEGKGLAQRYKINAYPTVLVLKSDGTELDRLVGFREPAIFIREFEAALQGKNSLKRAREAVAAAAPTVSAEEVRARQQLARELIRNGREAEALDEYLWLYEVGMKNVSSFVGVRLSFLTGDMGRLAKVFPPAGEALRRLRDDAHRRLAGDISDRDAPMEFAALNEALGDNELTLAMFRRLAADDPRRGRMESRVFMLLVRSQDYKEAVAVRSYAEMRQRLERGSPAGSQLPTDSLARIKRSLAQISLYDVEALAGAGELDHARELLELVLKTDSSAETKESAEKHLQRTGHVELLKP